ncbi:transporter substrate-binding domain-containing protein [Vibrio sp.]|nr:transporter substrate-binding domain-containing protein [Vibrio sp.]
MNFNTFTKVSLIVAMVSTAFSTYANANLLDSVKSSGELKCAVYTDVPPFSAPDPETRQLSGMDVDLCTALAKEMGVKVNLMPISIESRIAVIVTGRADVIIANLAYTKTRAKQIEYSDPYYVAKERLLVKKKDEEKKIADFKGQRISSTKGTTSEQSIHLKGGKAVTFPDSASAFLALQQGKVKGFVTNTMTGIKLIDQAKKDGIDLAMLEEPMALEPIGVGMKKGEPELLDAVNKSLKTMDDSGVIDGVWNKWIGPKTIYKMTRKEKVQPLSSLNFEPLD